MDWLAAAIFIARGAMLLGGIGFALIAVHQLPNARGWTGTKRGSAMIAGAVIGAAVGGCLIAATFFESVWAPPPTLRFALPQSFRPR